MVETLSCLNDIESRISRKLNATTEYEYWNGLSESRILFKLASFNVLTLMQIGQEMGLAMSLESLNIDICCLSNTLIQNSSQILRVHFLSATSESLFHVRLCGDLVASSSGFAGVDVSLSTWAEAILIDQIPINGRLCDVILESSIKVRKNWCEKRSLRYLRLRFDRS